MTKRKIAIVLCLLSLGGCAAEIARRQSAADDAKCREWGSRPGEAVYVNCRAQLQAARTVADSAGGYYNPPPPTPTPQLPNLSPPPVLPPPVPPPLHH